MQIFYDEYIKYFKTQPASILEIGSRDGNHAEHLRSLANIEPSSVFLIEPHPQSFKTMIAAYPAFTSFQLAISDKPGVVNFNAIPDVYNIHIMGTSSLLPVVDDPTWRSHPPPTWIKVLAITGETLLQLINRFELDLVKIDVEGCTYEVLKSFGYGIRHLKALHLEVEIAPYKIWKNQHFYQEIQEYMSSWGFQEVHFHLAFEGQGDSVWMRIE